MNKIILLVGESGSGKDTVADYLHSKYKLQKLKSYTTRPKRYKNEDTHTFITDEVFGSLTDIIAETFFNGYKYCATSGQVDNADIYIIDPVGIDNFMKMYSGKKKPVIVYLNVSRYERLMRMEKREGLIKASQRLAFDDEAFTDVNSERWLGVDFWSMPNYNSENTADWIYEKVWCE